METRTSHLCTLRHNFSFKAELITSQKTQPSKWQKVYGLMPFLVDGSLSVLNFRRLSMHILLKSDLGHLPDAWNGLNQESLKICPQINQLWKHYFQKWIAFCSPCDLVPGLLICCSKLQFCFQMWIKCNRHWFLLLLAPLLKVFFWYFPWSSRTLDRW